MQLLSMHTPYGSLIMHHIYPLSIERRFGLAARRLAGAKEAGGGGGTALTLVRLHSYIVFVPFFCVSFVSFINRPAASSRPRPSCLQQGPVHGMLEVRGARGSGEARPGEGRVRRLVWRALPRRCPPQGHTLSSFFSQHPNRAIRRRQTSTRQKSR